MSQTPIPTVGAQRAVPALVDKRLFGEKAQRAVPLRNSRNNSDSRLSPYSLLLCLLLVVSLLQACGGGITTVIPEEVRLSAKTWRIMYRYDYSAGTLERERVTASNRSLVDAVKTELLNDVTLLYNDSPGADITVTIAERQETEGYGQIGGLTKRKTVYYVEFFDRSGKRLGGYYDRNQRFIRTHNDPALVHQLAEAILIALNGE